MNLLIIYFTTTKICEGKTHQFIQWILKYNFVNIQFLLFGNLHNNKNTTEKRSDNNKLQENINTFTTIIMQENSLKQVVENRSEQVVPVGQRALDFL